MERKVKWKKNLRWRECEGRARTPRLILNFSAFSSPSSTERGEEEGEVEGEDEEEAILANYSRIPTYRWRMWALILRLSFFLTLTLILVSCSTFTVVDPEFP